MSRLLVLGLLASYASFAVLAYLVLRALANHAHSRALAVGRVFVVVCMAAGLLSVAVAVYYDAFRHQSTVVAPVAGPQGQTISAPADFSHLTTDWVPFVETHILAQPIVYRDFSVSGYFVRDSTVGRESCLVGHIDQSVCVENRSGAVVSYPITVYMSELTLKCETVSVLRADIYRTGQPTVTIDSADLSQSMVSVPDGRVRYFRRPLILEPHEQIRLHFQVAVGAHWTDRYSSRPRFPTTGMELVLTLPDDVVASVQREWNHPLFRSDDDLDPHLLWTREKATLPGGIAATTYRLGVKGPVLPHNALEIRWFARAE